jgi:hypothetical protein
MEEKKYNSGKITKLWPYLVKLHNNAPEAFEDPDYLKATVSGVWPELKDPASCPNCHQGMHSYIYRLDFLNALLLKQMGDVVRKRLDQGELFSKSNEIHVVSQDFHDCVRHRTTQCRSLGLIAKVKTEDGSHDRAKGWLITKRGFSALRGQYVPSEVEVFRNRITERTEEVTTMDIVFSNYRGENRDLVGKRDPMDWITLGKVYQGIL